MKPHYQIIASLSLLLLWSCSTPKDSIDPIDTLHPGQGMLNIRVAMDAKTLTTKSITPPDVSTFALDIKQGTTTVKHLNSLGSSTQNIALDEGNYEVSCYSGVQIKPIFSAPIYGASESVHITSGEESSTNLTCYQTNSGVQVVYSEAFRTNHASFSTLIIQGGESLSYTASDVLAGRVGYFAPDYITVRVSADGRTYESEIRLNPRSLYVLSIDDESLGGALGEMNLSISVSTEVTEESLAITFPNEGTEGDVEDSSLPYRETMGGTNVGSFVVVSAFTGWLSPDITYDATGVDVMSSSSSMNYSGSSGGNSLRFFTTTGGVLDVSGLNTLGYANLTLSFGCSNYYKTFITSEFVVSVSSDGINYTPLTYTRPANQNWELLTFTSEIPSCVNLRLRFTSSAKGYQLDDLSITGSN